MRGPASYVRQRLSRGLRFRLVRAYRSAGDRSDAAQRSQTLEHRGANAGKCAETRVWSAEEVDPHETSRLKSERHPLQLDKRPHEQPRAHEQHERHRDLDHDESADRTRRDVVPPSPLVSHCAACRPIPAGAHLRTAPARSRRECLSRRRLPNSKSERPARRARRRGRRATAAEAQR